MSFHLKVALNMEIWTPSNIGSFGLTESKSKTASLFNAAKFPRRPLVEWCAVTLPRDETRGN